MERPNLIIYGRVIALSDEQVIPASEAGKQPMRKRQLYIDCTRYDSLTGERDEKENKPVLEFGGDKVMDKLKTFALAKGDVVMVKFAIQGTPYKDKESGKMKVFTAIRCYDIELIRKADGTVPQYQSAHQPTGQAPMVEQGQQAVMQQQVAAPAEQPIVDDGLPF